MLPDQRVGIDIEHAAIHSGLSFNICTYASLTELRIGILVPSGLTAHLRGSYQSEDSAIVQLRGPNVALAAAPALALQNRMIGGNASRVLWSLNPVITFLGNPIEDRQMLALTGLFSSQIAETQPGQEWVLTPGTYLIRISNAHLSSKQILANLYEA